VNTPAEVADREGMRFAPYDAVAGLDARLAARCGAPKVAVALSTLLLAGIATVQADPTPAEPALAVAAAFSTPAPAAAPGAVLGPQRPRSAAAPLRSLRVGPPPAVGAPPSASAPPAVPVAPFPAAAPAPHAAPAPPAAAPVPAGEPPAAAAAAAPAAPATPARWLPTGTGMWLHEWHRTEGGDAAAVVARSLASGLSHLYVQTGSTKKGWIGEEVLSELLPATSGTGLSVIAWDFPKLIDPEADARRLVQAATWQRPGVPRVAAVAPDVETAAEGTRLSADAVTRYYATLRAELPPEVAILATVPWPSEKRTRSYPYAETAAHSDAFVPMAYWYNRRPWVVTATSMEWLKRFGKPVMPVGQGYDGRLDAPYLAADPAPDKSVQAFVNAAQEAGAQSISLWSWQTTGDLQWGVLARAGAPAAP
jgi:hypothetical protein